MVAIGFICGWQVLHPVVVSDQWKNTHTIVKVNFFSSIISNGITHSHIGFIVNLNNIVILNYYYY